ncbi:MAG TPA: ATP-binding protein [Symbiobacteriaceae bacterium]|jgi:signal transduction histidine kinase
MRERRLQTYLLLVLFVAATVPALVVGTFELIGVRHSYKIAADAQHARAVALGEQVSAYVDTHARAVRTLARQLQTTGDVTKLDLQGILDTMRDEYPGIVATFIGDAAGNALAFSPPTNLAGQPLAGKNYKGAAYFEPLMRTKAMVYGDVVLGAAYKKPLVTMVAPLLDGQGNVRNYISGGLDLSKLSGWLSLYAEYPGEIILLVDNKDTLIAQSGPVNYADLAKLGDQVHIQKMRSGLLGWGSTTELGGYATVPGPLDWGVAIITPRAALYADLRSTLTNIAWMVSLALVLGWAMAGFLARTMNQPITALMKAALAVRRGDMQSRVSSPRTLIPKEMIELHDSFNQMVAALQQNQADMMQLNATLEERVDQRTREVTRRSRELAVLNATAASVTGVLELGDRLKEVARGIVELVGADVGTLVLRHPAGGLDLEAVYVSEINWPPPAQEELSGGMAGATIAEGRPVVISDVATHRHMFGAWADDYPHASVCCVPMRAAGNIVGILSAINVQTNYFDEHSVELLSTLAGQVGPAVSNAWLFAEVQEQRNTLLSITNSMHEGLLLVAPGHRVQFANRAAATLLNLERLPAPETPLADFFTHWSGGNPGAVLSPAAAGDDGFTVPFVDMELPGPPRRTVAAIAFPVLGEGLTHLGYGILLRDVTQERQLERSKDELIANVSHELRTPLTTILGNTGTLLNLRAELEPAEQAEFLEGIAEESRRLKDLIEDVLDMSRISSGLLKLDCNPEPWQPLVSRALKRAGQRWPEHRFEANLPADLPMVKVDAARVEQVLDNLLNNAAQYSPAGSAITVSATAHSGFLLTWVQDTGTGINPEHLERIFDRFYRGDGPQVRRVRGTGLGLAICRGIVEAHGGRIWAESTRGQGSTFTFTVPVAATEEEGGESA